MARQEAQEGGMDEGGNRFDDEYAGGNEEQEGENQPLQLLDSTLL